MTFDELFRKYYVPMVLYADRTLRDRHVSENVVQDVFVRLWKQHGTMDGGTDLKNYLFVMVRNRMLDELRRRRVERKYRSDVARMAAESEEDDRFEMEVYERLYAAIDQLPKKTAEVLRLKLMGMSYEDIARRQDISPETVHSHLRHGIARLRGKISKDLLSLLFL
ncbi:RNA polymerase sigma-70 factor [Segatella baroniae F0067]|uniref:RNA polymerase sigma-70 factor n=1 Tax=Segatella baroniae F0067 TaxID=1115809 RepID=U2P584_9BACT|nr:RNA polymerase sigma-70 factor [Segatella baroniae]ERK39321.1 RNA polymerase sigma-70 factor [Segatella baroniae F0067]